MGVNTNSWIKCSNCGKDGLVKKSNVDVELPEDWFWLEYQITADSVATPFCGLCARNYQLGYNDKWWTGDFSHVLDFLPPYASPACKCNSRDLFNFGCQCGFAQLEK